MYLATVLDAYPRRLVGWSITEHLRTELVAEALEAAARARGGLEGVRTYADHGQHTSSQFQTVCRQLIPGT